MPTTISGRCHAKAVPHLRDPAKNESTGREKQTIECECTIIMMVSLQIESARIPTDLLIMGLSEVFYLGHVGFPTSSQAIERFVARRTRAPAKLEAKDSKHGGRWSASPATLSQFHSGFEELFRIHSSLSSNR
jgi:hypothetical protein